MDEKYYKVEKGIPIPEPNTGGRNGMVVDLLRTMEIGDSSLIPYTEISSVRCQITFLKKEPDHGHKKFTTRRLSPDEVRIWREK